MPRGRKRKDPVDVPIDADYRLDQVTNPQKGMKYAGVIADDMPVMLARGYRRVEKTPDGVRPTYDMSAEGDTEFRLGASRLLLMEIPQARADAFQDLAHKRAAERIAQVRRDANKGVAAKNMAGGGKLEQEVHS